jgi:hypothetical protein
MTRPLKLDLLAIDNAVGMQWTEQVRRDITAAKLELVRVKARANWLRKQGRNPGHAGEREAELTAWIAVMTSGK